MTNDATIPTETERIRAGHAIALRVIADLHAAYGKGVKMTIDAEPEHVTWMHLYASGDGITAGFWDDGDVFDSSDMDVVAGGHLTILEHVRVFLHEYGYGAR